MYSFRRRALCVWLMWDGALCSVYILKSSEWVAVVGMGYILCLVGGRKSMFVCMRVHVCDCNVVTSFSL